MGFKTDGDHIALTLDIPGVKAQDFKIRIEDGYLTVSGSRDDMKFSRRYSLNDTVDTSKVEANLSNGVLVVKAPKVAKPEPTMITVTEGVACEKVQDGIEPGW